MPQEYTVFKNVTLIITIYFLFKVDDDVFVNLDAFDMLGDFPELEILESSAESNTSTSAAAASNNSDNTGMNQNTPEPPANQGGEAVVTTSSVEKENEQASTRMDYREGTANITDYSPEWAYPEVSEIWRLPYTPPPLI
jgi:hypothetical protein